MTKELKKWVDFAKQEFPNSLNSHYDLTMDILTDVGYSTDEIDKMTELVNAVIGRSDDETIKEAFEDFNN